MVCRLAQVYQVDTADLLDDRSSWAAGHPTDVVSLVHAMPPRAWIRSSTGLCTRTRPPPDGDGPPAGGSVAVSSFR